MSGPVADGVKRLAESVLARSKAERTEAVVYSVDSSLTRFANNEIHQNVAQRDVSVTVRAGVGRRYGLASTNDVSEAGLEAAAAQALEVARTVPEQEEWLPLAAPSPLPAVDGYDVETAEFGPMQRAVAVGTVCRLAKDRGLTAAGAFKISAGSVTVANSEGLYAQHESTAADLMTVVMDGDASGHAGRLSPRVRDIDAEAVAEEAVSKAELGRDPRSLPPGEYDVVLGEFAVSDMLDFLGYVGLGARAVQEGRSFMSSKLGTPVMGANVTLWDDPLDASGMVRPFDAEGAPAQRVDMIVDGIAQSPCYDRRTGAKEGRPSTDHALPPSYSMGPTPRNMFLKPGGAARDDLVRSMKRGLLINRFWYTRVVHPLTVHMTGMTRDGTFLVEDGEIVASVKNLRFTESYVGALNRVEAIGKETKLVREFFSANRVPMLRIGGWTFTGA